ncbi:N-acyl homoserine lactonase family protein [Paraburkholderia sp. B3]|uniref:N-acyl homoserine lactonase family protein n=1 Tax=Paraburkholderia sp. B3 TaxID=3134791 RepID=UPI003982A76F
MSRYSIWVLEYSYIEAVPVSVQIYAAHNEGTRRIPFAYVLIKGSGVVAMIDVGFNRKDYGAVLAEEFDIVNWRSPATVLAECGVTPEDVTHVFLTHAHYDHMGGIEAFPNATFYIQERELSKWVWAMALDRRFRFLMSATDPADILRAVDLARQGRLKCVNGDVEDVLSGIDLHAAFDTHTWGSMFVRVRNDGRRDSDDNWIFAGDNVYCFENLVGRDASDPEYLPIGLAVGSHTEILFSIDQMVRLAGGDPRRVVPVHEDRLGTKFPCRTTREGLRVFEIALGDGESSLTTA